jgi:hypothetical protein
MTDAKVIIVLSLILGDMSLGATSTVDHAYMGVLV